MPLSANFNILISSKLNVSVSTDRILSSFLFVFYCFFCLGIFSSNIGHFEFNCVAGYFCITLNILIFCSGTQLRSLGNIWYFEVLLSRFIGQDQSSAQFYYWRWLFWVLCPMYYEVFLVWLVWTDTILTLCEHLALISQVFLDSFFSNLR